LASVYRNQGDLDDAQKYATQAIEAMQEVQDKYHLPLHLALLADLEAKSANLGEADMLYGQATDVVEGLLVNVPSRQVESSLIARESQLYLGHFSLAVTQLTDVNKAYEILETARGRSIADALRSPPVRPVRTDPITQAAEKELNRIQLALLRETNRNERENLLERLFEAEQVLAPAGKPKTRLQQAAIRAHPVDLARIRRSLRSDEMVLEYVLDEPNSFCLHITRSGAAITVLPSGRKLVEDLVEKYLTEVRSRKGGAETGENLYSMLLQLIPGQESRARLIIVADFHDLSPRDFHHHSPTPGF
jgi:vacuolar-type H+-ATPase subunit E/Vma4